MNHRKSECEEQLTVADAGRRGGIETSKRHGLSFYRRIGAKGGKVTRERYSHMMGEFGRRGGRPRRPDPKTAEEGHRKRKEVKRSAHGVHPPPE